MQQKPVRFYITQDADEPVVRSVPVAPARPATASAPAPAREPETHAEATATASTPVRKIVPATRRTGGATGR
jgi:hypothetical protein